eukprot:6012664-Prymnesium_polylepis.1
MHPKGCRSVPRRYMHACAASIAAQPRYPHRSAAAREISCDGQQTCIVLLGGPSRSNATQTYAGRAKAHHLSSSSWAYLHVGQVVCAKRTVIVVVRATRVESSHIRSDGQVGEHNFQVCDVIRAETRRRAAMCREARRVAAAHTRLLRCRHWRRC